MPLSLFSFFSPHTLVFQVVAHKYCIMCVKRTVLLVLFTRFISNKLSNGNLAQAYVLSLRYHYATFDSPSFRPSSLPSMSLMTTFDPEMSQTSSSSIT